MYCLGVLKLLPLQGALPIAIIPRALPWAKSFCPFRACCWRVSALYLFPSAGDRWFRACCWRASALYLSLRPVTVGSGRAVGELLPFTFSLRLVTVGSGRAVGELLNLLGVPTVQVETYCSIQVITHYCLGNRVVAFDPEKAEYTQTKKTFAFLFFLKKTYFCLPIINNVLSLH